MPNPTDQDLLQHAAFVRRLAYHLLGDAEAAEDITQDALLTAIERPPRDGAKLRSWLGTVTRRLAFRRLRDEDRRRRKLERLEPPAAAEPPDSLAARRAILGRVATAVQDLNDVYLETVLLRYFEGLTPTEIARRLEVPLATVSSRLQRALAKLRTRLDADVGSRWRASLAAAVGLPASLGKVNTVSPHAKLFWSLTMTQATAAIALSTAALVLGSIYYISSTASISPQANATNSAQRLPELQSASEPLPAGKPVRKPAAAKATEPTRIRLVVNLQWQDGSPARAIRATLRSDDGQATRPVIADEQLSVVEFSNLSPGAHHLRIAGSSREYALKLEAGPIAQRTIEMTPATEFRGRVTASDGTPIAGAWITGGGWDLLGLSDSDGSFHVRSLGKVRTFACRAQHYAASTYRPCPAPGEEAHVVLTPGGATLEGWVMDPDSEPAAFATVMVGEPFRGESVVASDGSRVDQYDRVRVRTNAKGYFIAVGLRPGQVPLRVPASDSRWPDYSQQLDLVAGATQAVRIRLPRACSVTGVAHDRAGAAVARARIAIRWGPEVEQQDQTYTDEAGRFQLHDLPPGPVVLLAEAGANGQCRERIILPPGRETQWRPQLHLGTVGRIVDAKGLPVASVEVIAAAGSFEASVTTGKNGEFSILDCPDSLTSLYVIAGPQRILGHWSDVDVRHSGLFLQLAANAGIPCKVSIRVLGPDGIPVEDARLSLGEPGQAPRIGSGRPDDDGWIRLNGPIYGVQFEARVRSAALGQVHLGVRAPTADGVLDFGTIRMQNPGQLALKVRPVELHGLVERFVIETLDGTEMVSGTGMPTSGLRLAPGDYRVKLIGDRLAPAAVEFAIASETVTDHTLEVAAHKR